MDSKLAWLNNAESQFFVKELSVTVPDYSKAIDDLYSLACSSHGSNKLAAHVLLSAYNPKEYPLTLEHIYNSSPDIVSLFITVLRGLSTLHLEPHLAVELGYEKFLRLKNDWASLLNTPPSHKI